MKNIKNVISASTIFVIGLCTSITISAMEPQESTPKQRILMIRDIVEREMQIRKREKDIQRLQKQLKSPFHTTIQLQKELQRLQTPIANKLQEQSLEIERQIQELYELQPQGLQPIQQEKLNLLHQRQEQQIDLEERAEEELEKQYQREQVQQFQLKEIQQKLELRAHQKQEIKEEEEQACIICMEDKELCTIPCKNKHNDQICKSCLAKIKNSTNFCPMCREPLL